MTSRRCRARRQRRKRRRGTRAQRRHRRFTRVYRRRAPPRLFVHSLVSVLRLIRCLERTQHHIARGHHTHLHVERAVVARKQIMRIALRRRMTHLHQCTSHEMQQRRRRRTRRCLLRLGPQALDLRTQVFTLALRLHKLREHTIRARLERRRIVAHNVLHNHSAALLDDLLQRRTYILRLVLELFMEQTRPIRWRYHRYT